MTSSPTVAGSDAAPDHAQTPLDRYAPLLLALATLALLLPFLNKAFYIDDPLFLAAARQIRAHPANPYGFVINWYGSPLPIWQVINHPPGACYFIAAAAGLVGWSEPALHAAFLLPALGAVLGTYRLARSLCPRPAAAATITLLCPVFLISSTTVMSDTLMLCFWVWAVALWVEGIASGGWVKPVAAGLLAAAAALTKYPGMNLIPLLAAYALVRRRRPSWHLAALLIPVGAAVACELWTRRLYGTGVLSITTGYAKSSRHDNARPLTLTALNMLSFAGGCVLPALLLFPFLASRIVRWLGLAVFALLIIALTQGWLGPILVLDMSDDLNMGVICQLALFALGGLAVLVLTAQDLGSRRDAGSLLLALWVGGTLVFVGLLNWTINARSVLPLAPAVGILLARRLGPAGAVGLSIRRDWRWLIPLGLAGLVSLGGAYADQSTANADRTAAERIAQTYAQRRGRLWFEGHWGFQFYMERGRALALDDKAMRLLPGDLVAIPMCNSGIRPLPDGAAAKPEEFALPVCGWMSVHNGFTGAGFYSDIWGSAPFVIGPVQPLNFVVLEVTKPLTGPLPNGPG